MQVLETFRNALALSEEMAKLAREQAWDALSAKERQRAALLATVPAALPASPHDSAALAEVIKQIQACDSEVREFVEPWMEHTQGLLAGLATKTVRE
jgi:DNA-binding transcriptional regulator YbjK